MNLFIGHVIAWVRFMTSATSAPKGNSRYYIKKPKFYFQRKQSMVTLEKQLHWVNVKQKTFR